MRALNYKTEYQKLLTPEIVSYLAQIHEMKGRQNLFVEARKDRDEQDDTQGAERTRDRRLS